MFVVYPRSSGSPEECLGTGWPAAENWSASLSEGWLNQRGLPICFPNTASRLYAQRDYLGPLRRSDGQDGVRMHLSAAEKVRRKRQGKGHVQLIGANLSWGQRCGSDWQYGGVGGEAYVLKTGTGTEGIQKIQLKRSGDPRRSQQVCDRRSRGRLHSRGYLGISRS